jgi:uncharacterized damage-inducible protein DinB
MTEEQLFSQMALIRSRTVKWIEAVDPAIVDIMPTNFNNTIHWHIGHILFIQDRITLRLIGKDIAFPEEYNAWFSNGTKPADWTTQPPAVYFLLQELKDQTERLQKQLSGNLTEKLTTPFIHYETVEESLGHTLYHEGIHLGYMMALKRAIEAKAQ